MATAAPPSEIEYPSSDGEPMAETPIHRDAMFESIDMLKAYYADEPNVYVSGKHDDVYVDGNADKSVSPDVFVTVGIPKLPERRIYQMWREGKGPDVVIEVTSTSTARVDQRRKFDLYRDVLRVREYILFDPREQTLAGADLCGFRLVKGEYEWIPKNGEGRVVSEVLGLELEASGDHLRLYDPRRGVYLPTLDEIREALERESAARLAAEAKVERDREALERESAARLAAEAEVERLRREIEALRRATPPSP